jgi:hypothetical protein
MRIESRNNEAENQFLPSAGLRSTALHIGLMARDEDAFFGRRTFAYADAGGIGDVREIVAARTFPRW